MYILFLDDTLHLEGTVKYR